MTIDESTYFKDSNQVVIFQDIKGTPSGVYGITGQRYNSGSGTTKIFFGESGIGGSVIKASSAMKFSVTMTDAGITEFGFHGCTFQNAATISLPAYNANKIVQNCSFIACAGVVVNTCTVTTCNFISSTAEAILISSISHNTTSCNFISCAVGVKLDTYNASAYPFNALIFTNTTYHVNNTSAQTLTVGNSNGSNASIYTGTLVNFTGSVQLTMTVKNAAGGVIVGAFAYIDDNDQSPFIMNTTTNSSGIATITYTGSPITGSRWRVRKYGYKDFKQLIDIAGSNISLPITLVADPQQT